MYDIETSNIFHARAIKDAFSLFWRRNSRRRLPEELKGITITNVTTFCTRIRVRLLKELCKLHQAANPHLSCFVTSYLPRPELKIRDKKEPMITFSYSDAITRLSHHLTPEFLTGLTRFARTNVPESELVDRFVVLNPDLLSGGAVGGDLSAMSIDLAPALNASTSLLPPTSTPLPSSQDVRLNSTAPAPETSDGFTVVAKKQRSRFAKKSHPYPPRS